MDVKILWVILLGCFYVQCFTMANAEEKKVLHILPLGDSITQAGRSDREEYGYRYPLFYMLKDAGVSFDYVGSMTTGLHKDATWPAINGVEFDLHHEGHYGWKTAAVRDHLAEWMQTYTAAPDIVLLHLGTNDQKSNDYNKTVVQPLEAIIWMLRGRNPHVKVFVGHLMFNDGAALKIRPLVDEMCQRLSTEASPVTAVNMFKGWIENPKTEGADTFDWAHPNPKGQKKMAKKWFDAISPVLTQMQNSNEKK